MTSIDSFNLIDPHRHHIDGKNAQSSWRAGTPSILSDVIFEKSLAVVERPRFDLK